MRYKQDLNKPVDKQRSFLDEFNYPLDKVQRNWLRRSALITLTPIAIPLGALGGIFDLIEGLYKDCW